FAPARSVPDAAAIWSGSQYECHSSIRGRRLFCRVARRSADARSKAWVRLERVRRRAGYGPLSLSICQTSSGCRTGAHLTSPRSLGLYATKRPERTSVGQLPAVLLFA